jgi:SAM-dependent methyltransferase
MADRDRRVRARGFARVVAGLARIYAAQLIGLLPDVILASSTTNLRIIQEATSTVPVVFIAVLLTEEAAFFSEFARAVAPAGRVAALDISGPMLAEGKARADAAGISNVDWQQADAATAALSGFDLLTSAFGLMFFGDPVAAFAHMRRAANNGARMAFVCWRQLDENLWMQVPMNAVAHRLPPRPKPVPNAPGMFALAERSRTLSRPHLAPRSLRQRAAEIDDKDESVLINRLGGRGLLRSTSNFRGSHAEPCSTGNGGPQSGWLDGSVSSKRAHIQGRIKINFLVN